MKAPEHCEKKPWHTNTQFPGDVFDLSFLLLKATVFNTLSLSQVSQIHASCWWFVLCLIMQRFHSTAAMVNHTFTHLLLFCYALQVVYFFYNNSSWNQEFLWPWPPTYGLVKCIRNTLLLLAAYHGFATVGLTQIFASNFTLTFTMILGYDMKLIIACELVMYNQNTKNQVNISFKYYEIHSFNLLQNSTCLVVD